MTRPVPYSDEGEKTALDEADFFTEELVDEASRLARRAGADRTSAEHVRRAAANLYSGRIDRRRDFDLAVGGLLGGGAISAFTSLLLVEEPPTWALVIAAIALFVGAYLLSRGVNR